MKNYLGILTLLLTLWTAQSVQGANRFNVNEEVFAYWLKGIEHLPDSVTVQVADSLLRRGTEENNDTILLMSENLTYILYYYKFDEPNFYEHASRCRDLCKKLGNHHMYVTTVNNINNFYVTVGMPDKALAGAKDLLEEGKITGDAETLLYAYYELCNLSYSSGQYRECIDMAHHCLRLHEQNPEIAIEPLAAYRNLALSYMDVCNVDSCEYYLKICEERDPNFAEAPYLRALMDWSLHEDEKYFQKQYDKLMAMGPSVLHTESTFRQQMQMMKYAIDGDIESAKAIGIPEGFSRRNSVSSLAQIYGYAKDYRNASKTYKLLTLVLDSLNNEKVQELQTKFRVEMETVYETKEKEKQILRQTYILIICLIILVALVVFVFFMVKKNREIRKKNLALTVRINEMLDTRQKEIQTQQTQPEPKLADNETEGEDDEMRVHRQVERVIYEIVKRELFTNPDFKRDDLLDELHINKRNFAHDFEATTGQSFTRYILGLRLDYAALQIREHPDYSNDAIAEMCGIQSRSSFYRNFSDYFGLSPVAYRDSLSSCENK